MERGADREQSQEAFHTFNRSGMDILVLGNYVIENSALQQNT